MTIDPAQVIDPAPGSFYAPEAPTVIPAAPTPAPALAVPAAAQQEPLEAIPAPAPVDTDEADELPTGMEVLDSLTHFDELAIKRAFREALSGMDETTTVRAMWFTVLRRAGVDDQNALDTVLKARWGDVKAQFRVETDDGDEVSRPEA